MNINNKELLIAAIHNYGDHPQRKSSWFIPYGLGYIQITLTNRSKQISFRITNIDEIDKRPELQEYIDELWWE